MKFLGRRFSKASVTKGVGPEQLRQTNRQPSPSAFGQGAEREQATPRMSQDLYFH